MKKVSLGIVLLFSVQILIGQVNYTVTFDYTNLTQTSKDDWARFSYPNAVIYTNPGEPELPAIVVNLIIPSGKSISSVDTKITNQKQIGTYKIYPTQYPEPTSIYYKSEWVSPNEEIYNSSDVFPAEIIKINKDGYFDGATHIVQLLVTPILYIPKEGTVTFIGEISITLNFTDEKKSISTPVSRENKFQKYYDLIINRLVDNKSDISKYQVKPVSRKPLAKTSKIQTTPEFYKYVVITNNTLKPSFADFVAWKIREGLDIGIVTIEEIMSSYSTDYISGITDTAGAIRQYLADSYYSTTNTMWVLLGGEDSVIPIRFGAASLNTNSYHHTVLADLYYSDFTGDWDVDHDYYSDDFDAGDGNYENLAKKPRYGEPNNIYGWGDNPDYYPEVFIGRLLVSSAEEIDTWTKKYLNYVLYPNNGNFTYLGNALHTQADQMQWYSQFAPSQADLIDDITEPFWSTTIIREDIEYGKATYPEAADVINYMNTNDYGLILFSNHGGVAEITVASNGMNVSEPRASLISYWPDFGWDAGLDDNLEVKNTPFIVYSIACDIGGFDYDFSWSSILKHGFIEAFIVEDNLNAVAVAGNTRYGYWTTSFDLEKSFFNAIVDDDNYNDYPCRKMGVGVVASKVGNTDTYLDYSNNYFGDPEMSIWVGIPSQLSSASVTVNSSNIVVNAGVSGCDICVSSGNNGSSYYLAVSGVQSYTFSTSVRPLYITITKPNYIPYTAVTGGTFTTAETWFGNLHLLGTVAFTGNGSLKLLPGTKVLMDGVYGIGFYDNARLIAEGTAESPIVFTSTNGTTPQSWNRLYIRTSNNILRYCEVEYSNWGLHFYGYPSSGNLIDHCHIHDNDQGIRNELSTLAIKGCEIHNNRHNIVSINNPQVEIDGNRIYNGGRDGVYSQSNNLINFYGNVIENNGLGGVYSLNGIYTGYSDVINIGNRFEWAGYNTIRSNYSSEIYAYSNALVQVFFNSVHDNTGYEVYNVSGQNIQAPFNWWGEAPPNPTQFYGSVNYFDEFEIEPDWEGETFYGRLSKPIVKDPDKFITSAERIASLKTMIASEPKSARADSALQELFSIVRSDYVDNQLQEKEHFYLYLTNLYSAYKNYPVGQAALQYMIIWQTLAGEYQAAIALALKALDNLKGSIQSNILLNLFNLYTYTNQFDLANETLTRIKNQCLSPELDVEFLTEALTDKLTLYEFEKSLKKETLPPQAEPPQISEQLLLHRVYPNPFNPTTQIEFALPATNLVEMSVYDLLGRIIWQSGKVNYPIGTHSITWDGTNQSGQPVSTGIYLVRLATPGQTVFQKVLLMK